MSKFIIEKDVPMPEKHVGKYPLSDMEVGIVSSPHSAPKMSP